MNEEIKKQIEKEADDYGFQVPFDGTENFYDKARVEGYLAGATKYAEEVERLKIELSVLQIKHANAMQLLKKYEKPSLLDKP